jgi:hypothetical protein
MAMPRPQSLPVMLLVKSAFQIVWQQRDDALRLGFIPTLIFFGGLLYGRDALNVLISHWEQGMMTPTEPSMQVLVMLLIAILAVALAIASWLRFMLLGPMGAIGLGLAIGRPHISFLVSGMLLTFAGSIAFTVLNMPVLMLPSPLAGIGSVVAFVIVLVAMVRLSPFVIAQVIAQPISLQDSWRASRGNGIPLTFALILVQVPLWLTVSLLDRVLNAVGFADVAPLAMEFIYAVFQIATSLLQASILAAAYRQMVGVQA